MSNKRKRRVPQCARCRTHNTFASVRGHKKQCQWKDCTCAKCLMVTEKRRVTAVRVAVLRRERKRRMTHRMGLDAFHFNLQSAGAWSMMGPAVGAYSAERHPVSDNRRLAITGEPYYNEMVQMKYRGVHRYGNEYLLMPGERLACPNEEPEKADSGISRNLENFQHEYESLMRKVNEHGAVQTRELSPSNHARMTTSPHSSTGPPTARVCVPPASPTHYMDRSLMTHGNYHQPRLPQLPHDRQSYHPVMLTPTHTLPCPCPVTPADYSCGFYI